MSKRPLAIPARVGCCTVFSFAFPVATSMTNDGFSSSDFSGWFNYLKNTQHLDYVITKAGNGDSLNSQYTSTVVNAAIPPAKASTGRSNEIS